MQADHDFRMYVSIPRGIPLHTTTIDDGFIALALTVIVAATVARIVRSSNIGITNRRFELEGYRSFSCYPGPWNGTTTTTTTTFGNPGKPHKLQCCFPECPAIIITPATARYPLTPGWKVANVDYCLATGRLTYSAGLRFEPLSL